MYFLLSLLFNAWRFVQLAKIWGKRMWGCLVGYICLRCTNAWNASTVLLRLLPYKFHYEYGTGDCSCCTYLVWWGKNWPKILVKSCTGACFGEYSFLDNHLTLIWACARKRKWKVPQGDWIELRKACTVWPCVWQRVFWSLCFQSPRILLKINKLVDLHRYNFICR